MEVAELSELNTNVPFIHGTLAKRGYDEKITVMFSEIRKYL